MHTIHTTGRIYSQTYLFSKFKITFEFPFSFCFYRRGQEGEQHNNPKDFHLRIGSKPLSKSEERDQRLFPPTKYNVSLREEFNAVCTRIPRLIEPNPPPKQNSLH